MIIGTSNPTGSIKVVIGKTLATVKSMGSECLISLLLSDDGTLRPFSIALRAEAYPFFVFSRLARIYYNGQSVLTVVPHRNLVS